MSRRICHQRNVYEIFQSTIFEHVSSTFIVWPPMHTNCITVPISLPFHTSPVSHSNLFSSKAPILTSFKSWSTWKLMKAVTSHTIFSLHFNCTFFLVNVFRWSILSSLSQQCCPKLFLLLTYVTKFIAAYDTVLHGKQTAIPNNK